MSEMHSESVRCACDAVVRVVQQRWDQVLVSQVSIKSQAFALKSRQASPGPKLFSSSPKRH